MNSFEALAVVFLCRQLMNASAQIRSGFIWLDHFYKAFLFVFMLNFIVILQANSVITYLYCATVLLDGCCLL